jgi:hypothetical protein
LRSHVDVLRSHVDVLWLHVDVLRGHVKVLRSYVDLFPCNVDIFPHPVEVLRVILSQIGWFIYLTMSIKKATILSSNRKDGCSYIFVESRTCYGFFIGPMVAFGFSSFLGNVAGCLIGSALGGGCFLSSCFGVDDDGVPVSKSFPEIGGGGSMV